MRDDLGRGRGLNGYELFIQEMSGRGSSGSWGPAFCCSLLDVAVRFQRLFCIKPFGACVNSGSIIRDRQAGFVQLVSQHKGQGILHYPKPCVLLL
jgi:hypothetical protein